MLTQERLKEVLDYNPDTGLFLRRSGTKAGNLPKVQPNTHIMISVDGKSYIAKKLAWLYMTGSWPVGEIVQIDNMKHDNRFCNLLCITHKDRFQTQTPYRNHTNGIALLANQRHQTAQQGALKVVGKG